MRAITKIAALLTMLAIPVVAVAADCPCGANCPCTDCPCAQHHTK